MDVLGTKDHAEREDEEANRLVRPLPKKKPPRRDLRREQMHPDRDPDLDADPDLKGDPDLSLNYKSIGGAVGLIARVVQKFSEETKLIPVRLRETGRVVNVSEETLKKEPSKYEKLEDGEGQEEKKPPAKSEHLQKFVEDFNNPKSELAQRAEKDPYKFFEELADPSTDVGQIAQSHPDFEVGAIFKNIGLPPEIRTFSDVVGIIRQRIDEAKEQGKGRGKKKQPRQEAPAPKSKPPVETPKEEPAPAAQESEPAAQESEPAAEATPAPKEEVSQPEEVTPVEPTVEAPSEPATPEDESKTPKPKKPPAKPKEDEPKTPKPKKPRALSDDAVKEWVGEKRYDDNEFKSFGAALPTSKKTDEGLLFYDAEAKDHVPFNKLNPKDQGKLIAEFSAGQKQKKLDAKLEKLDPKVRRAIADLADPKSEISRKISDLKKQGHPIEGVPVEKLFPELKDLDLGGLETLPDMMDAAPAVAKSEAAKRPPAPPERKEVSKADMVRAMDKLLDNLPPEEAGKFFHLHPKDAGSLIRAYKEFKAENLDSKALLERATGYVTDPNQVATLPKEGRFPAVDGEGKPKLNVEGKQLYTKKPYATLSEPEKAEAMQQHRMAAIAASLLAKNKVAEEFAKDGLPKHLAPKLADVSLSLSAAKPEERERKARQVSKELFTQAGSGFLGVSEEPDERFGSSRPSAPPQLMNEAQKKRYLKSIQKLDPHTQMAAVAHLQGEDYHAAFKQFLDPKSPDAISEHDTASSIYHKMSNAAEALGRSSRLYPANIVRSLTNPADVFKGRVRTLLRKMDPEKEAELTKKFGKLEGEAYEKNLKRFEKEAEEHKKALEVYDRKRKLWEAAKADHESQGASGYRDAPKQFDQPEPAPPPAPIPPMKPRGYEPKTSGKDKKEAPTDEKERTKTASIFSSYPSMRGQMGTSAHSIQDIVEAVKTAFYHGVEPYPKGHEGFAPYTKWTQAHQRDLGPEDSTRLLVEARRWLQQPVLSENIEGMIPDARFRAALDLSISSVDSGKYNGAINPVLYNELLSKLSSTKTSNTTAEGNMKLEKDQANQTLSRLDRLAGHIQTNAQKWGMPFEVAKAIVNDLDKTADEIEVASFGARSFEARQVNVLKSAKVIQQDSDESYMKTFNAPMAPHQTDGDEPYMSQFKDDQSQAVESGKSTTGRPLAP